ncbi:MAG: hypothetical protein WAN20_09270 [Pseudonocardiaceae bacterium]
MSITDRDRKILWGRSGNRCALCRRPLVAERTPLDLEAVVGDEAHIAAQSSGGPRYGECPPDQVDSYDNLILLCRYDHKKVDDQWRHYTRTRLLQVKAAHEAWVDEELADQPAPVRIEDDPDSPALTALRCLTTGIEVWDTIQGSGHYYLSDLDEAGASAEDLDCSSQFLQNAKDWGDLSSDIVAHGMRAVREAKNSLADDLQMLRERGLLVFGGRRRRIITGGVGPPQPWNDVYLVVTRADDESIVKPGDGD